MARDNYIIRPKLPLRPKPKPPTREEQLHAIARRVIDDVAKNIEARQSSVPRKPRRP
ncbi:MAG: hypothetical protein AAF601_01130 [Pseudomonadota bacterium]